MNYLQRIDTNTTGNRYDVTPLFADYEAFTALVNDLAAPFVDTEIDLIAGIDALGFVLATAVSTKLHKGILTIRKGGKLPVPTDRISFVDYSGEQKSLEIRADAPLSGKNVLLVDEWIETGAQIRAAVQLIEGKNGRVAGIASINIDENEATRTLQKQYRCHSIGLE